ncbi:MAG: cupin domain-containing protein [Gemmatimonadetes bacterium]|nr:cupin domain-containing protein [Gemmatimonadota bacterium]
MTEYRPHAHGLPPAHTEHAAFPPLLVVDLAATAAAVRVAYRNDVLLDVNDHCLRLAVMVGGESRWHAHPRSDECFVVLEGVLHVEQADGRDARVGPGHAYAVPAGVVHRTRAEGRTVLLCLEHRAAYTDVEFATEDASGARPAALPPAEAPPRQAGAS